MFMSIGTSSEAEPPHCGEGSFFANGFVIFGIVFGISIALLGNVTLRSAKASKEKKRRYQQKYRIKWWKGSLLRGGGKVTLYSSHT